MAGCKYYVNTNFFVDHAARRLAMEYGIAIRSVPVAIRLGVKCINHRTGEEHAPI